MAYDFARIRAFYRDHKADIERGDLDPYAWDHELGIVLTPIESALWQDIRQEGAVFYPQYPVGRFFVDFGNPLKRVAIECDGKQWHMNKERDAARQHEIEAMGWTVYRITGRDCFTDTIERQDEVGRVRAEPGYASRLIREICARHGT